jgi:PAS domain S-box-containing protein
MVRQPKPRVHEHIPTPAGIFRAAQAGFEVVFRHNPVAMAITRASDGTVLDANDAWCALFDLERASVIGRTTPDLKLWTSPDQRTATVTCQVADGHTSGREVQTALGHRVRVSMIAFEHVRESCLLTVVEDISSTRGAEDALRESEARWKFALEGSGSGVWDWNVETGEVFFSVQWKAMLGYAPDEIAGHVDEWASRVHPDDVDATMALVRDHLEGRSAEYVSEHRVRARDGTFRWILDRGRVVSRTADGRALRVVGTHTDITALKEAERRFKAIFHSTFQFIGLLDPDGIVLEANRTALDFAGMQLADVVGRPFWDTHWWLVGDATRDQLRQAIRAAAKGHFVRYEVDVQNRHGDLVRIDFSLKPIHDASGRVVQLVPEGRDISAVRHAEAARRESDERFRSAFTSAGIGMALVSLEGRFLMVNQALCDIVGYDEQALLALTFQDITHPDDLEADLQQARQLAAGDVHRYQMEKRYVRQDGATRWVRLTGSAVRGDGEAARYYIAQVEDIDEQKATVDALGQALREKDILLREVHHRVKNNLQVVSSLLSLQRRALDDPLAREALGDTLRRVSAMALVHDRLYLESGASVVNMRTYMSDLARQTVLASDGATARATTLVDAEGMLPLDTAIDCGFIVSELTGNALKHAFPPGRTGSIQVSLKPDGNDLVLTVADNGVGRPASPRASAVGLQIVDGLSRKLRGTVTMKDGQGLTVVVRFPRPSMELNE